MFSIIIVVENKGTMSNQVNISNTPRKPFAEFRSVRKVKRTYLNSRTHRTEKVEPHAKTKALAGSLIGVGLSMLACAKRQKLPLTDIKSYFKIKYGVVEMVTMSGFGIIGGVTGGMIGSKKKKEKMNEGVFQFMNATVPLLAVSPALKLFDASPIKDNKIFRIGTIFAALLVGMKGAAELSNFINDPHDKTPDRKLTMKDALVNMDDALGALAVAKVPFVDKFEKLLPMVYTWCGYRAGQSN